MKYGVRKYSSSGRRRTQTEIRDSYYSLYKVKCKCGSSLLIMDRSGKMPCYHCGRMVYRSKRDEFKDKIKKELRRKKDE